MTVGVRGTVLGTRDVPAPVRSLSSLSRIDYADHFSLVTEAEATPEQWARAMFGDAANPSEWFIWRGLLGLRLHRGRSAATVAGWRIGGAGDGWIRLEADSWFLAGNLLFRAAQGWVSLSTFVRYDRRPARVVWPPLSAVHRRLVPGGLRDAAVSVQATAPVGSTVDHVRR